MIAYAHKRTYRRMERQCPVSVRDRAAGPEKTAKLLDLSAGGVRFVGRRERASGA